MTMQMPVAMQTTVKPPSTTTTTTTSMRRLRPRPSSRRLVVSRASDVEEAIERLVRYNAANDVTFCDGIDAWVQEDIDRLIDEGRVDGGVERAVDGDGTWRVFCAPHIARLATPVGVRFDPLRYDLSGGKIRSDVRHRGIVPDGWLSASGSIRACEEPYVVDGRPRPACKIEFDSFWIGSGATADQPRDSPKATGDANAVDSIIDAIGRVGFIEDVATFPVLFYDDRAGLVVFQFPPLKSNIAAYRVGVSKL